MGEPSLANQWNFDSDDDDNADGQGQQTQLPKPARDHMRKLEKENTDLKKRVDEFLATQRTSGLTDKVKAKGYDPMVASLIPSTVEGDAVDKWLDDHSSVLAKAVPESDGGAEDEGGLTPEQQAALKAMTNIATSSVIPTKPQDLLAQMQDPTLTKDKLDAILRSQGAKF